MSRDPPLLGFIQVQGGCDGTQEFEFQGRTVPPVSMGCPDDSHDSDASNAESQRDSNKRKSKMVRAAETLPESTRSDSVTLPTPTSKKAKRTKVPMSWSPIKILQRENGGYRSCQSPYRRIYGLFWEMEHCTMDLRHCANTRNPATSPLHSSISII